MAIKPIDGHLEWVTDNNPAKYLAPSGAKRLQGWTANEKPPFQYFNWAWRLIDRWLKWAEATGDEHAAAIAAEILARTSADQTHAGLTVAHGATVTPTAERIMMWGIGGRAKSAAPVAADDVARKAEVDAVIPVGTPMLFVQTAAPIGWTKSVTHNNKALRVVSGTAGSGGSVAFSTAFANRTVTGTTAGGTVGNTTLSTNQMPSHPHSITVQSEGSGGDGGRVATGNGTVQSPAATQPAGGGGAHGHSFTGTQHDHALNMAVQYVDVIICTKN